MGRRRTNFSLLIGMLLLLPLSLYAETDQSSAEEAHACDDTEVVELEKALSQFSTDEAAVKTDVPTIWSQGEPASEESNPVIEAAIDEGSPTQGKAQVVEIPPDQPDVIDASLGTPFVGTEPSADVFITILRPAGQPAESGHDQNQEAQSAQELKKKEFKITLVKEIPAKEPSERLKNRHFRSRKPASTSK